MGIDINQLVQHKGQWTEISKKLDECREHLLFLGEGVYQTEHAKWFVTLGGSIMVQPISDQSQQTELFKDDET